MDDVPYDRILELARWIALRRSPNPKETRRGVAAWAEGKETRMTPWGIQLYHPDRKLWIPLMRYDTHAVICGRWIRDIEVPESYAGHPDECTCYGRPPPKMVFSDPPHWNSGVVQAFQHNELTSPQLDLAERLPATTLPESQSTTCLLMELPPELLELILDYLVPTGQIYHFFPARNGKKLVQIVQKFVPEKSTASSEPSIQATQSSLFCSNASIAPNSLKSIQASNPRNPATGSSHTALAGTCRQFQHIIYTRLFTHNSFIFHLTPHTIHSEIRSTNFTKFRGWTRTTQHTPKALGPLTGRAAEYLKNVTLIASLPYSHGSGDIKALSVLVSDTATMLSKAKLSRLAIALNLAKPGSNDNRFSLQAIPVDLLRADVDSDGSLTVSLSNPVIDAGIRESNKTQQALATLLQGPKNVKEVILSGSISESFARQLHDALIGS